MSNDLCKLEGWLIKKKGDYHKKNKFFHHDNMRWFKLQEVKGNDHSELALCYFKSQRDKEPRGWIYVKDVSQIVDTETSFTVVSPARTMTIEATTPVELTTWLRAMVESCPHADTSRVYSSSVRYGSHRNNAQAGNNGGNSKEDEIDYDEYRPLDKDSLLKLDTSAREKGDPATSVKSLDRSISLFSRNADGDKNSFYYASSGQTQQLGSGEHNKSGTFSSDDDFHSNGHNHQILGEGELMDELGGMNQTNQKHQAAQSSGRDKARSNSASRRGVADDASTGSNSRDGREGREGREGKEGREDHRLAGRGMMGGGGYGGGDSSTSNRLHRHIARDTPPRAGAHLTNGNGGSRHHRGLSNHSHVSGHSSEDENPDHSGGTGTGADSPFRVSQATDEGGAFDSASSLYVHRDSPHNAGTGGANVRHFPQLAPSSDTSSSTGHHSPSRMHHQQVDSQLEVTSLASSQQEHDRIAHSRARLREKHRKKHQRNNSSSGRNALNGSGSDSDHKSDGRSESSSSSSGEDYERSQRLASSNSNATRRRNMSRDSADEGNGRASNNASPAFRAADGNSGGGGSAGSGRVPAPLGAPPRRARDAMLAEAANDIARSGSGSGRVSIDDVLKRRPNSVDDAADAKETSPRSAGGRGSSSSGRTEGAGGDSDDEAEFDFKSERRHYNSREGDFDNAAGQSGTSATGSSTGAVGGSRPPRPPGGIKPPSGSSNIYSASAAAVIAGKTLPVSTASASVGVGSGGSHNSSISSGGSSGSSGGSNFTFSQASLHQSSGGSTNAAGVTHNPRRGTSTPPRQAGDPGAKVDSNFVDEDWDAEEGGTVTLSQSVPQKNHHHHHHHQHHNNNVHTAEAKGLPEDRAHCKDTDFDDDDDNNDYSSNNRRANTKNYPSTVRADPNWLDENFDDA